MGNNRKSRRFTGVSVVIAIAIIVLILVATGIIKIDNLSFNLFETTTQQTTSSTSTSSTSSSQVVIPEEITDKDYLKVYFIDVGQADSILIEDSVNGEKTFMLIDAGTSKGYSAKNLIAFLKSKNIDKLKYFIMTHPHSDHIAAADEVINTFKVEKAFLPDCTYGTTTWNNVLTALDTHKDVEIEIVDKEDLGDVYYVGKSNFEILWPEEPSKVKEDDINEVSIVVRLTYGENSFMFTGDAEGENELKIVKNNKDRDLTCDVLKAGHHGSSTASYQEFLDFIKPKYVIISCGAGNSYGHPHKEPMARFQKMNMTILRTDLLGTIEIVSNGKELTVVE